jgi:hypothetical protein
MSNGSRRFTLWHGLLLAEGAALMIALVMPITPSKTGSGRGLARFLIPEPTYFEQVVVYFVLTNILILIIGGILWLWTKLS